MNRKEYLETRKGQEELLARITDAIQGSDPVVAELISLQNKCQDYESKSFHAEDNPVLPVDMEPLEIAGAIRQALRARMSLNDYLRLLVRLDMDDISGFSWTTDLRKGKDCEDETQNDNLMLVVPEPILAKYGWDTGDMFRLTVLDDSIKMEKIEVE